MLYSKYKDVKAWHRALNLPVDSVEFDSPDFVALRVRLICEEACETIEALTGHRVELVIKEKIQNPDPNNFIKECQDLIWVTEGGLVEIGVDSDAAWERVKESNWTKVGAEKDAGGKAMKGKNYIAPDMSGLYRKCSSK